jgi:hypothetical protein
MQRTWRLQPAEPEDDGPRPPEISRRGLCLMQIEFLLRFPASECIVTSASLQHMDFVMDMFPKTLFHVFCAQLEDPPRPNVIRHNAVFDRAVAAAWRDRGGAPFHVIFTGEGMDNQMALHVTACPAAALHIMSTPPDHYLAGELVFPLYCSPDSCISGMVPDPAGNNGGGFRAQQYCRRVYLKALRDFHSWYAAEHSPAAEEAILDAYARSHCENKTGGVDLLTLVLKAGLPSAAESLLFMPAGSGQ